MIISPLRCPGALSSLFRHGFRVLGFVGLVMLLGLLVLLAVWQREVSVGEVYQRGSLDDQRGSLGLSAWKPGLSAWKPGVISVAGLSAWKPEIISVRGYQRGWVINVVGLSAWKPGVISVQAWRYQRGSVVTGVQVGLVNSNSYV
jgi:hypothetical protein